MIKNGAIWDFVCMYVDGFCYLFPFKYKGETS